MKYAGGDDQLNNFIYNRKETYRPFKFKDFTNQSIFTKD